jgi:hypothetical protein
MTRKQSISSDPSEHRVSVTLANIQHVRIGARRRPARQAGTVVAVRPLLAERQGS